MNQTHTDSLIEEIIEITSQNPLLCYQCGKCSAGCPIRAFMEMPPNRVVRFVQLGLFDKALKSPTIWLCAGCQTCFTRCPQKFDLVKFMDALKEIAIREGIKPPEKKISAFHKAFLKQIKKYGRAYELGLVRDYKLSTFDFFQDMDVAPKMFLKGKINICPHKIKNKEAIRKIFEKSKSKGK